MKGANSSNACAHMQKIQRLQADLEEAHRYSELHHKAMTQMKEKYV